MRLWKVCTVYGEYKEHYAYGTCKKCYCKERHKDRYKKSTNTKSSNYLGCDIAEKILSKVFNDVEMMKPNNPGYDFICNKGKKIDVKSGCIRKNHNGWSFGINKNIIADFFLCIAFDDRESLTPLYLWLIPSNEVKDKKIAGISQSTIYKWDDFKLDISKTLQCCNQMKR